MSDETKKIQITRIEEKFGVKVSTGSHTVIVLPAHMEILVGGPYEKHGQIQPYGHVAIRVTISQSDMTYDFGRYGKTWGAGDSEGEGMLRVWTDFSKYITGEKATGRTTTGYSFTLTGTQANAVNEYFASKISELKAVQDRGYMQQYRLATDYHALKCNCTTESLAGARQALPGLDTNGKKYIEGNGLNWKEKTAAKLVGWPEQLFMPADLENFLKSRVSTDSLVVEIYK